MQDDGPSGRRAQVDERGDDEFTRAPLDPADPAGVSPSAASIATRRRALTLAATALLVAVVVVGLFVHSASDPRGAVGALLGLPTPTPAATFIPGANVIYFSNGALWGTLTVDGKRLPQADLSGHGAAVTRGAHHLVYQARYFPSVRCVFSAPQASSDTCKLDTSFDTSQFLADKPLARVINLGSTGATLQPDQRATLLRLANTQLQARALTATIAPGERYLDDRRQVVAASAPLQFHMTLALGDTPGFSGADCAQICSESTLSNDPNLSGGSWLANVTVTVTWAITDTSGRRLISSDIQAQQPGAASSLTQLGIQLTSAGWKLNWLDNLPIMAVEEYASAATDQAVNSSGQPNYGESFMPALNPLNGCVIDLEYGNSNGTAQVFWRFGVLLAVDAAAHNALPALPVANAQEQAAVTSILTRPSAT